MSTATKEPPKKPIYVRASTHALIKERTDKTGHLLWKWVDKQLLDVLEGKLVPANSRKSGS